MDRGARQPQLAEPPVGLWLGRDTLPLGAFPGGGLLHHDDAQAGILGRPPRDGRVSGGQVFQVRKACALQADGFL